MRKFVSLAIGMALGLIAWWSVSAFLATSPPPRAIEPTTKAEDHARPPPLAPAQRGDDAASHASHSSREMEGEKPPVAVAPPRGVTLHGTVIAIDETGSERADLDGSFKLHWTEAKQAKSLDVAVHRGRFTTDAPQVAAIAVDDVLVGDRIGRLADAEVAIPASGEVALRVKLIPASSLRVVDARSRAELDGIDVWCSLDRVRGENRLLPRLDEGAATIAATAATMVATGAHSPIVLPPIEGTPNYWIHVAGYAWTLVEVQQLVGGEREVPLVRGGTLALRFLERPERDDLVVFVRNATTLQSCSAAINGATREFADVAPGHFEIEAVVASPAAPSALPDRRSVVGRAECDVVAGATARVELSLGDVAAAAAVAHVPFRGVVVSADARLTMELSARLSSLDPARRVRGPDRFLVRSLAADPDHAGQWSFDFGTVVPGRALVTIQPLQVHTIFEIGPEGLVDAQIELPVLGEVEVAVTDAETGAAIDNAGISWRSANHPMADNDLPQTVATHGDPPSARFLAPLGRITVSAWPDNYTTGERELEVLTSLQRVTIAVGREQYVRIVYRQGSAVVPIDPGVMEFMVVDGDGRNHAIGWAKEAQTGALKLIVDLPGDYTVRFSRLAGFRTPDDRPVHVGSGATVDVEVDLELK